MNDGPMGEDVRSISTIIKQTGLPTTLKGRATRFILRLASGAFDNPHFEAIREKIDLIDGRRRVNAMVYEEIGRQAIMDPDYMERAKARLLGETYRKQDNVEAVLLLTDQMVECDPNANADDGMQSPDLNADWINSFTRAAEDASSDQLRERLAALLVSEIRKPGSVSRSTIRMVAEMDGEVLRAFQVVLPHRIGASLVSLPEWNKSPFFETGTMLEGEGLVTSREGFTNIEMSFDHNGMCMVSHENNALAFVGTSSLKKTFPIWRLTRVGEQIADLMPPTDNTSGLRFLVETIDKTGLSAIHLGQISYRDPVSGQVAISPATQVWPPVLPTTPTPHV